MKVLRFLLYAAIAIIGIVALIFIGVRLQQETQVLNEAVRHEGPGQFIQLSNGLTHYRVQGNKDGELVILIHGGGITGMEVWSANAHYLAEQGYLVLTYDLYGRGYSDRTTGEYTPELLLNQLNELTTALSLSDSMSIISMSMGSMVALDFATQHPDKVKSLVMIDPAITGDYKPNPLLKYPVVSDLLMTLYWYPRTVENQRKEFVDPAVFAPYSKRLEYFMNIEGYKHMNYSTWMNTLNQDKSDLLANLNTSSVLLLYGDKDPYFSASQATKLKTLRPTIEITSVTDAGHMPHFEKSTIVNPLLVEFLNRTNSRLTTEKQE
jgi:pimeloyl-ACP methyl ester carboxylesterase